MKNIGKDFMEYSKYKHLGESDQAKGMAQPPLEVEYLDGEVIRLSKDIMETDAKLDEVILQRKSLRKYADKPMTLDELTYLLWSTQGIKTKNEKVTMRTVPSAGARHPFHTFVLVNNVEGLTPGIYRYNALSHTLVSYNLKEGIDQDTVAACLGQPFVATAAATFIWTVDIYRASYRYGERAYRYVHLDAGHVCQNLYLAAEAIDCGVCAVAAFDDDALNDLLEIGGEKEFAIYVAPVGKK